MRKILLFGTSGNPPTGRDGHSGIVDYFVTLGVCVSPDDFRCCWCLNQRPTKHARRSWQYVLLWLLLLVVARC